MIAYKKKEARSWAWENLKGVYNVVIPSYSRDLTRLNENGIRHDIRRELECGFSGTLLVSETAVTLAEYGQFVTWAHDEAKGRLKLVLQTSFNTLEENIEAAKISEAAGVELALLTYPPSFYPRDLEEIYQYTKTFCDNTNLAVMLFPVPTWGFDRLHGADIPAPILRRLIDDCPNVVAIKAEGGYPGIMGQVECHRLFGKEVIVSCPMENDMIPLAQILPIQLSATSNTEYFGSMIPHIFNLLQKKDYDEATRLFWQTQPARKANIVANAPSIAANMFINRMIWKYQAWLQGFNGGPLRQPTNKISEAVMNALRAGLAKSGLAPTESHNHEFFVGRNPD